MVAQRLDPDCHAQEVFFLDALGCHHIDQLRLAFGQCTGLVERDGCQPPQIFKRRAAFDQDAATRGACDPAENRAWRRNCERAGARRHQNRHGAIERVAEGFLDNEAREQKCDDENQYRRNENAFELIGKALCGRLIGFGLVHHLDDTCECRIRGCPRNLNFQRAAAVNRAGENTAFSIHRVGVIRGTGRILDG